MKNYTKQEIEKTIAEEEIVVVDFFASWCGPCKMLAPVLEEVSEIVSSDVIIAKVDVDQEQELAQKYNVRNIPTIIFFKKGEVVATEIGYRTSKFLVEAIEKIKQT